MPALAANRAPDRVLLPRVAGGQSSPRASEIAGNPMRIIAVDNRQSADVIAHHFGDCVMQDFIGIGNDQVLSAASSTVMLPMAGFSKARTVPHTVFIDPQLGRIGLTETEARNKGLQIRVEKLPMSSVTRAIELSETRGFMKVVVEVGTKQILGCAVLGIEGGELMAMFEIAIMAHLPYTALKDGVFAHPTLAESLNSLFMAMDSRATV